MRTAAKLLKLFCAFATFLVPTSSFAQYIRTGTEVSGSASDFEESFRAGTKQEIVDHLFVLQHHWCQVAGECEDYV
jgi:hypothetical protein